MEHGKKTCHCVVTTPSKMSAEGLWTSGCRKRWRHSHFWKSPSTCERCDAPTQLLDNGFGICVAYNLQFETSRLTLSIPCLETVQTWGWPVSDNNIWCAALETFARRFALSRHETLVAAACRTWRWVCKEWKHFISVSLHMPWSKGMNMYELYARDNNYGFGTPCFLPPAQAQKHCTASWVVLRGNAVPQILQRNCWKNVETTPVFQPKSTGQTCPQRQRNQRHSHNTVPKGRLHGRPFSYSSSSKQRTALPPRKT